MKHKKNTQNIIPLEEIEFSEELEKLEGKVLFTEKLEKANQFLKKYGLPKEIEDRLKQR